MTAMFYAGSVELYLAYGSGDIKIFDATGRQITHVFAFGPETGEVIRYQPSSNRNIVHTTTRVIFDNPLWHSSFREGAYYLFGIPWLRISSDHLAVDVWRRHGFWPAPLRVVPVGGPVPAGIPYRVGDGAQERCIDFTEAPCLAGLETVKGAIKRVSKLMAGLALPGKLIDAVRNEE